MQTRLFSTYQMGSLALKNRLSVPPMCTYRADSDACPTIWHTVHYGKLANSGAGLICLESIAVSPEGRISPRDLGIWNDTQRDRLAELLVAMRSVDDSAKVIVQLNHAGRKASAMNGKTVPYSEGGWETLAPSAVTYSADYTIPAEMREGDIEQLIADFVAASLRVREAGFDGIELHFAHGYLMHQFLSPLSNVREDAFGGSYENRLTVPMRVFEAVRAAVPDICVGVRVSATDWVEGGWDVAATIELLRRLKAKGCEFVDVSSGGLSELQKIDTCYGYHLPMTKAIKEAVGMPTIACGFIKYAAQAETVLATEVADMVDVGRAMLLNPHWGWQAALELDDKTVEFPSAYVRGMYL